MGRASRRARWRLVAVSIAVVGGTTLAALPVSALPSSSGAGTPTLHGHSSKVEPLIDHGGPVLGASVTYDIWWGATSSWPGGLQTGIESFLGGLDKSAFLGVAAQYMRGAGVSSRNGGSWDDPSSPPAKVSVAALAAEVDRALGQGTIPSAPDPNGVYLVYTSNFPKGGGFCAWHSGATVAGVPVAVAYLPNVAGVAGCADPLPSTFSQDPTLAAQANDTSHEFMESITDPQITAWYDQAGREIGDKCETTYGGVTTLSNRSTWYLQDEWSNAAAGCVSAG